MNTNKALTLNTCAQYFASRRTEEFEEQLFCCDRSVKYRQPISVDDAEPGTDFDNCTTQTGVAVEISQQQH